MSRRISFLILFLSIGCLNACASFPSAPLTHPERGPLVDFEDLIRQHHPKRPEKKPVEPAIKSYSIHTIKDNNHV